MHAHERPRRGSPDLQSQHKGLSEAILPKRRAATNPAITAKWTPRRLALKVAAMRNLFSLKALFGRPGAVQARLFHTPPEPYA